nr:unnamed protein product [Digitaria exilis]
MAQAAVESALNGDSLIGRQAGVPRMKRKTPSELRGEQLKRRTSEKVANDQLPSAAAFDSGNGDSAKLDSSVPSTSDAAKPGFKKVEKCSENALRSVSELHVGDEKQTGSNKFDMEKVLKGFGARDASVVTGLSASAVHVGDAALKSSDICPSKITIPGKRVPLDFTVKTSLQFVSSSSVKWWVCHKLNTSFGRSSITGAIGQTCPRGCQNLECPKPESKKEFLFSKALQSWVYPQSLLPSSIISALLSSTARGENDYLLKRHQDWEDSFQNLYYMLRKNMVNIFYGTFLHHRTHYFMFHCAYSLSNLINHTEHHFLVTVYTAQFVALFIGGSHLEKKQSCNAYLSQSTRGLRSLLRKHGVCFSMPLCNTEVEQATEDDLIELSEIQRRNLGQALHLDALSDVDNTTQSLLAFTGNESVHGLYDILLNYKSLLNSLSAADVPALYSPQPFQNGCLHIPEVKCREMRRADMGLLSSGGFDTEPGSAFASTPGNICYSMEIKDVVLPPWVVSGVCAAMSADTRSFDLTIATEPSSMGLNAALKSMTKAPQPETAPPTDGGALVGSIPGAVLVPSLHSASLRRLSYTDGDYVAYTTV